MTFKEYQQACWDRLKPELRDGPKDLLLVYLSGKLATETSEFLSDILKNVFHKKDLPLGKQVDEMGDTFFYIACILKVLDVEPEEIMISNDAKLNMRHGKEYRPDFYVQGQS